MNIDLSPIELVVLQGTSFCNINCSYCDLSPESRRVNAPMGLDLIEALFSELFQGTRLASSCTVVWHSGEPLTLPPAYYDEAISLILELQRRYQADAVSLRIAIQTNGVLINEDWCRFFERHRDRLDLGVSCDGPADMHDAYRIGWNGRGSHARTVRGMDMLRQHGIPYKLIAVVTPRALAEPEAFYEFFFRRREELSGFHFNLVAESTATQPELRYSADDRDAYYAFYRRLLELNRTSAARGTPFDILNFTLAADQVLAAGALADSTAPLKALNMDAQGNITTFHAGLSRDVLPDLYGDGQGFALGNIRQMPLEAMAHSEKLKLMTGDFLSSRRACQSSCEYFEMCPGGYEIIKKKAFGTFEASETVECLIHVKTLFDAFLDDLDACAAVDRGELD